MPFQPPHYEYPQQTVFADPVGGLTKGAAQGLELYAKTLQVSKMNQQNKLNEEIGQAYDAAEKEIAAIKKPEEPAPANVPAPNQDETIKRMMGAENAAKNSEVPGMGAAPSFSGGIEKTPTPFDAAQTEKDIAANQEAKANYDKDVTDYHHKVFSIRAKMMDNIINLNYKHGFPEEAQKLEEKYIEQTANVAKFIDPKLAENIWNNSVMAEKYGKATIKAKNEDDWVQLKDGSGAYKKTDPSKVYKFPTSIEDFIGKPTKLGEGQSLKTLLPDGKGGVMEVTLLTNPKDNTKEQKRDEREQKKEERQQINDNLTTNKQYYKDLKTSATAFIKENEGTDDKAAAVLVQKYKSVLQKLPDYERFDRDHILKGLEPVNANKVLQFLEQQPTETQSKTNRKPLSTFKK